MTGRDVILALVWMFHFSAPVLASKVTSLPDSRPTITRSSSAEVELEGMSVSSFDHRCRPVLRSIEKSRFELVTKTEFELTEAGWDLVVTLPRFTPQRKRPVS